MTKLPFPEGCKSILDAALELHMLNTGSLETCNMDLRGEELRAFLLERLAGWDHTPAQNRCAAFDEAVLAVVKAALDERSWWLQ